MTARLSPFDLEHADAAEQSRAAASACSRSWRLPWTNDTRTLFADALRELADAVEPKLGTMNYYFGPGARTAVSHSSVMEYRRIKEAVAKARAVLADALSEASC